MRNDYELLDFGNGRRLERFGSFILDRPCPAAEHYCFTKPVLQNQTHAKFVIASQHSERGYWTAQPDAWQVVFGKIVMELHCTPFGHVGVFPEQQTNWNRITTLLEEAAKQQTGTIHVLNLFAYTGGSSLAAALASPNIDVVHVDSAQNAIEKAKRNAQLNGLDRIRFITEDARKFVQRELRRKHYYDAVILDPPAYGHGRKGEAWKFSEHLPELLSDISGLLSENRYFILLTAHTTGYNCVDMRQMMEVAGISREWSWQPFAMTIPATTGKLLESGYGVWGVGCGEKSL